MPDSARFDQPALIEIKRLAAQMVGDYIIRDSLHTSGDN
jgi:hypothetical protein